LKITFDHLVLLVHDLDAAVADFGALGFTVLERADTSHGSTLFRFIPFDDGSYILLTAFAGEDGRKGHRLGSVLDSGEGWADYSFVVPNATEAGEALKAGGFAAKGPVKVSNVLAGGEAWSLDLLMTGRGAGGDVALPFLVSDNEGRNNRIPGPSRHANGARGIAGLTVSTGDPKTVIDTLAAIGGEKEAGAAKGARVRFSDVWVDVIPLAEAKAGRPGGGMVDVTVVSEAAGQPAGGRLVDIGKAHGAPILLRSA
jgi:catechol 2,3-dioxygenase-like lactoylglutathione lyase family enzyme